MIFKEKLEPLAKATIYPGWILLKAGNLEALFETNKPGIYNLFIYSGNLYLVLQSETQKKSRCRCLVSWM